MNGDHPPESGPQGGMPAPPQPPPQPPPASGSRNTILLIVGGIMALAILDIGLKSGSGSKSGGTSAVTGASAPAADKAASQVEAEQRLREAVQKAQKATLEVKKAQKAAAAAQQQLGLTRDVCERMRELGYIGDCDELVGGKKAARKATKAAKRSYRPKTVETKMTTLGRFTVNLRDSGNTQRVLQLELQVESALETAVKVEERMPQLRDSVILLASDYSDAELKGMDGKLRLRDEIEARLNAVLAPDTVDRVYFTAFVVQ